MMRVIFKITVFICLALMAEKAMADKTMADKVKADKTRAQTTNPNYDAELAATLGADDYGMKKFVLVILKTGSNTTGDKEAKGKAFAGHFKNMNRLVEEKKLIVAGPFGKNSQSYRGLFILYVASIEEANTLLQTDPAIKSKFLALFHNTVVPR